MIRKVQFNSIEKISQNSIKYNPIERFLFFVTVIMSPPDFQIQTIWITDHCFHHKPCKKLNSAYQQTLLCSNQIFFSLKEHFSGPIYFLKGRGFDKYYWSAEKCANIEFGGKWMVLTMDKSRSSTCGQSVHLSCKIQSSAIYRMSMISRSN